MSLTRKSRATSTARALLTQLDLRATRRRWADRRSHGAEVGDHEERVQRASGGARLGARSGEGRRPRRERRLQRVEAEERHARRSVAWPSRASRLISQRTANFRECTN
jgi:hypothetical protein